VNGALLLRLMSAWVMTRTPMRIRLLSSPATFTMFYITSFRLSLKGLNTTIYVNVHTASPSPLELDISQTRTSCSACCILELILGIRLNINSIIYWCSLFYPIISVLVLRFVSLLINEYCIVLVHSYYTIVRQVCAINATSAGHVMVAGYE